MKSVLILGGTSDIARACARQFAGSGWDLILASRRLDDLKPEAADLSIRFAADVEIMQFDVLDPEVFIRQWNLLDPKPDAVLCAVGSMEGNEEAKKNPETLKKIIDTNFTGCAMILSRIASDFCKRGFGDIMAIGSVAGDRGRAGNYPYGSAKAGLEAYLSGLRQDCREFGVSVMTVKPGFVRTGMTDDMDLPKLITAVPERVARDIARAWKRKYPVIYTPWFWRWIMFVVRHIPEQIFQRRKT